MTGGRILVESLLKEGVEVAFGFPGGVVLGLYDSLADSPIKHVLVRHEQAAAHAADGYARATGRVGVCIATSGPGSTNLVTGVATAHMDSVPLVAITGQVARHLIGADAFQEADIVGITRPITKHNFLVSSIEELAGTMKEAFYIARTGRPGPVLVDVPKDVLDGSCEFRYPSSVDLPSYRPTYFGNVGQVKKAAKEYIKSRRPVIISGGGVIISRAWRQVLELAEKTSVPVVSTFTGLGGFPAEHPLFLGMMGMHGTYAANMALNNSDLILSVGSRFSDRATGLIEQFAPHATIVHVDIDPSSISKNVQVAIPIVGDAKDVLKKLLKELDGVPEEPWEEKRKNWLALIEKWRSDFPTTYKQDDDIIKPQYVVECISELTDGEAIIATEVGQNQMWTAQFYKFRRPRSLITSGGLGTMGYGFPAAIGAQIGCRDRVVWDIAGDGGFQMNIQELATVVQEELPIKVAILDNKYLGMVRQWQEFFFGKRYSSSSIEVAPDWVKLAEAYGIVGMQVERPADVIPAIKKALSLPRAVLIDFLVDPTENVLPMVPPGKALKDMVFGPLGSDGKRGKKKGK